MPDSRFQRRSAGEYAKLEMIILGDLHSLVEGLKNSDNEHAYSCLKQLEDESRRSAAVYSYLDALVEMLDHPNSYIRSRSIILIAANARWDVRNRIDEVIDLYVKHIRDDSPITARQCIKALPLIVEHKPDLGACVVNALYNADPMRYKESMQLLIARDIQKALEMINKLQSAQRQRSGQIWEGRFQKD